MINNPNNNHNGIAVCTNTGFTMIELLVSMAVASILMIAVVSVQQLQSKAFRKSSLSLDMNQNIRASAYMLVREIRMAGLDINPDDATNFGITDIRSYDVTCALLSANDGGNTPDLNAQSSITFTASDYLNGDNVNETISYYLRGNPGELPNLERRNPAPLNGPDGTPGQVIATGIEMMSFAFSFDANGADNDGDGFPDGDGVPDFNDIDGDSFYFNDSDNNGFPWIDSENPVDPGYGQDFNDANDNGERDPGEILEVLDNPENPIEPVVWAFDSDNDGLLDRHLDTDGNGVIDESDTPGGAALAAIPLAPPTVNMANIKAVRLWLLARTNTLPMGYRDRNTYVVGHKHYTPNDGFERRLITMTINCRNL